MGGKGGSKGERKEREGVPECPNPELASLRTVFVIYLAYGTTNAIMKSEIFLQNFRDSDCPRCHMRVDEFV